MPRDGGPWRRILRTHGAAREPDWRSGIRRLSCARESDRPPRRRALSIFGTEPTTIRCERGLSPLALPKGTPCPGAGSRPAAGGKGGTGASDRRAGPDLSVPTEVGPAGARLRAQAVGSSAAAPEHRARFAWRSRPRRRHGQARTGWPDRGRPAASCHPEPGPRRPPGATVRTTAKAGACVGRGSTPPPPVSRCRDRAGRIAAPCPTERRSRCPGSRP